MGGDPEQRANELRALYEAKVKAELAAADALMPGSDTVLWGGDPIASIAIVKGRPGPAEASGGRALSGPDGQALAKALEALGWTPPQPFATLSRPIEAGGEAARTQRLRLQLEAVDPRVIVALDDIAAADLADAFLLDAFKADSPVVSRGRRFVALGGFEEVLGDERAKRMAWKRLKAAAPDGAIY